MNKNIRNQIKFVEIPKNKSPGNDPNTCYLQRNNWDDYGFQTTFTAFVTDEDEILSIAEACNVDIIISMNNEIAEGDAIKYVVYKEQRSLGLKFVSEDDFIDDLFERK